jgi:hypothetical protein
METNVGEEKSYTIESQSPNKLLKEAANEVLVEYYGMEIRVRGRNMARTAPQEMKRFKT